MPRPRKPTNLLKLTGAFAKNPQRQEARIGEAKPTGPLGPRVEKLTELEAACWDRIVAIAAPGVLMASDEGVVEQTARLWARLKLGTITGAEHGHLLKCWQQLACTPAARSLVKVDEGKTGNEFADI